ncbi:MAG: energy transducer TonB family protein [Oceanisphaera sp.]
MDRSGKVLSASLVGSSGASSLDKEALTLVKRALPLPKPPSSIAGQQLTLTVPINFSL